MNTAHPFLLRLALRTKMPFTSDASLPSAPQNAMACRCQPVSTGVNRLVVEAHAKLKIGEWNIRHRIAQHLSHRAQRPLLKHYVGGTLSVGR
jgi:hypothetical protein